MTNFGLQTAIIKIKDLIHKKNRISGNKVNTKKKQTILAGRLNLQQILIVNKFSIETIGINNQFR